jgi:hypothetical protein
MHIEQLSMALYRIEITDIDRGTKGDENNPRALRQMTEVYDNLYDCLQALGRFIRLETRDDGLVYTDSKTCLYNLHPDRLQPFMENVCPTLYPC